MFNINNDKLNCCYESYRSAMELSRGCSPKIYGQALIEKRKNKTTKRKKRR